MTTTIETPPRRNLTEESERLWIKPLGGELKPGDEVHVWSGRSPEGLFELYRVIGGFVDDWQYRPTDLADVRRLLLWTGVLINTPKCSGEAKAKALAARRVAAAARRVDRGGDQETREQNIAAAIRPYLAPYEDDIAKMIERVLSEEERPRTAEKERDFRAQDLRVGVVERVDVLAPSLDGGPRHTRLS